jgi:hypothetical protein
MLFAHAVSQPEEPEPVPTTARPQGHPVLERLARRARALSYRQRAASVHVSLGLFGTVRATHRRGARECRWYLDGAPVTRRELVARLSASPHVPPERRRWGRVARLDPFAPGRGP